MPERDEFFDELRRVLVSPPRGTDGAPQIEISSEGSTAKRNESSVHIARRRCTFAFLEFEWKVWEIQSKRTQIFIGSLANMFSLFRPHLENKL